MTVLLVTFLSHLSQYYNKNGDNNFVLNVKGDPIFVLGPEDGRFSEFGG